MTDLDFADAIKPKSNQLNADDLVAGPITVQITDARRGNAEQPIVLVLNGGHQPWKPCKTSLRLIAACTGTTKASALVGRWVRLYCDPSVRFGGQTVGGIRMNGMSGISKPVRANLTYTRGKKKEHVVHPIEAPSAPTKVSGDTLLRNACTDAGVSVEDVGRWLNTVHGADISQLSDDDKARLAEHDLPTVREWVVRSEA